MALGTGILRLSEAVCAIRDELEKFELRIEESTNFKKFTKVVAGLDGKDLSQQASLQFFDLIDQNAFWIGIYNKEGECISVQAARVENLGSMSLRDYWNIQQPRIYPKPNKIGKHHAPTAKLISGRVMYHGDFFIRSDFRNTGNAGLMVFLGFLIGQAKYDPDWIYGLMNAKLAKREFVNNACYTIIERRGTHWIDAPNGISGGDCLVATRRENVFHNARLLVEEGAGGFQSAVKV